MFLQISQAYGNMEGLSITTCGNFSWHTSLIVPKLCHAIHEGEIFHEVPRETREGEIIPDG